MILAVEDLKYVRQIVLERSSMVLDATKDYLIESRLSILASEQGFTSSADMVGCMRRTSDSPLHRRAVESMTINETSFFRDATLFESLRSFVLPALIEKRTHLKNLTIWSAACSTGQEPFSIAMLIREHFPELSSWNVRLIATDISTAVLARAIQGRFTPIEVSRGIRPDLLALYFTKTGSDWQIRQDIRTMVEFRENNLAGSWTTLPSLDLVLLRNVMIYFSLDVKRKTLAKVSQKLADDGCLVLGATETTNNIDDAFERVSLGPGQIYKLKRHSNAIKRFTQKTNHVR